jgi:hypothetical protein
MSSLPSFLDYLDETSAEWQQLDEAGLSRILSHIQHRNIGFITAFRGGSSVPVAQNRGRNRQLQTEIRQAGFGYLRVQGSWPENEGTPEERQVVEESFLVIGSEGDDSGNLKGFLKKAGAKYQQDAVIFKPWNTTTAYLIFMSNPSKLEPIGTFSLDPQNIGKMYSKFKGHKFVFHSMSEARGFFSRLAYHKGYK